MLNNSILTQISQIKISLIKKSLMKIFLIEVPPIEVLLIPPISSISRAVSVKLQTFQKILEISLYLNYIRYLFFLYQI